MADHQKIHPVLDRDVEAPHAAAEVPLVPRGASKSDRSDPADQQGKYPPLQRRTFPVMHSPPPIHKKRSCCRRCLCWTVCLLVLQVVVIAITGGIIYLVFRPKLPKYSVDQLQITQFNVSTDQTSLYATFDVNITARNPNKKIGIYYEGGSRLSVWYTRTKLCEGALPKFYQGHRNTTQLLVQMTGQNHDASGLLTDLQQQQQTGSVPLTLRVRQPVKIKLGSFKLPKIFFKVRCRLVVDSLKENNDITIKSSSCKFRGIRL